MGMQDIILEKTSCKHAPLLSLNLYTAPTLSAVITASGSSDEGQRYSLTCAVGGDESLMCRRSFHWDRVGGSMGISQAPTLRFNPLQRNNTAEYRCTVIITSPYLIGTRTVISRANLIVNSELCAVL